MMETLLSKYQGCLLGLACGDAIGTSVEFCPPGSFPPLSDMVGGGPFALPAGAWTDDMSMALCLAQSLLHCKGFDAKDQMNRYCNWRTFGYMSSIGECFDIGATVSRALDAYLATGNPYSGSTDPRSAGNGSLMRLAPIVMFYLGETEKLVFLAGESARTTHGAEEAVEATKLFASQLALALSGSDKQNILFENPFLTPSSKVKGLAQGDWRQKTEQGIRGSGYVIESLEAALWCFWRTDDYESAVLRAANLGDDADTTAAICGQLAGAYYGLEAIPLKWREKVYMGREICNLAEQILQHAKPNLHLS